LGTIEKLVLLPQTMMTRGIGIVGYNVQTAVDTRHHLIVEHDVTNNGSDRDQLSGMAKKARTVIGTPILTSIADRGYFKGEEILACHEAGIFALVPPTKTSGARADGRFDKADFIYDPLVFFTNGIFITSTNQNASDIRRISSKIIRWW
jgi:hypothetical protein